MRSLFLFLFLVLCFDQSLAQSVNGKILDANDKPAEFATIRLFTVIDSTVVKGTFAASNGF